MALIGFHASHEQFAPSELLGLAGHAEAAGFQAIKCSDHFKPWARTQGHSGFAWSWIGAAMAQSRLPFGLITAPGYRYHPAVVAQGAATLAEMFPGRFWLALGSGERLNEDVTGLAWPEKAERNARLGECAQIIRALLAAETVSHRGRVDVVDAKLYSLPAKSPKLYGAAVSEATAEWVGSWADGLLTIQAGPAQLRRMIEAFHRGGGEGKPMVLQVGLNWDASETAALAGAHEQWRFCAVGGEVNWDLRSPADFERIGRLVRPEDMKDALNVSADLGRHAAWLASYVELGFSEIYLHQVGRNQRAFIDAFGKEVLPQLA
ncbi:MAG: TIGR03885 family FMN-dependent LLM class oxidoreductase [Kaiparowitsia implicata GSE-PSE-MK54-09C]|jgi:probable non-F420 flavinoid oxidoreductase|nr:TIGR03885 family FMN-dependent LLM class oxidoreductase [Kaiparowitsia implicata GSE-PSE-MK54-09C]